MDDLHADFCLKFSDIVLFQLKYFQKVENKSKSSIRMFRLLAFSTLDITFYTNIERAYLTAITNDYGFKL